MPSYLSVILFALTNYRTDGIKPPIRSWQTSLPPQKEKDCHGRMSPTISAPQKKPSELSCHLLPHACSHLPASVGCCIYLWPPRHPNTYVSSHILLHFFPRPHVSLYIHPLPLPIHFNLQVELLLVVGSRCCKALEGIESTIFCVLRQRGGEHKGGVRKIKMEI